MVHCLYQTAGESYFMNQRDNTLVTQTLTHCNQMDELGLKVSEAKRLLDDSLAWFKGDSAAWLTEAQRTLTDVRLMRMALSVELAKLQGDLKDLKEVIASEDTKKAIEGLHTLVMLMNKLSESRDRKALEPILDYLLKRELNDGSKAA